LGKRATALRVVPTHEGQRENLLNDLTGAEWLFWTSTIFETFYPADATHKLRKRHGAMKPPEVMAEIIRFFTKQGEEVLDPFAGVGGTLLGAAMTGRKAIGYEINAEWVEIYNQIQREFAVADGRLVRWSEIAEEDGPRSDATAITAPLLVGDCMQLLAGLPDQSIDAVITDPPYGCQHGATGFRNETNFNMNATGDPLDFSNAGDMVEFLERMEGLGCQAWRVLRPGRYLVLMIGDRYMRGEFVPLGVMVAETMRRVGFQFKGMRLWWNKATQRPLRPYAVKTCFVPNIVHQNILVLRKGE
jgi:DNA modification methylase